MSHKIYFSNFPRGKGIAQGNIILFPPIILWDPQMLMEIFAHPSSRTFPDGMADKQHDTIFPNHQKYYP
jgi:hypothetical protein